MPSPAPSSPSGAADQIVDVQVLVSHPPPNVDEGPVSTSRQGQVATAGLIATISHGTSSQFAQGVLSGQVKNAKLAVHVHARSVGVEGTA
jgi:hypothetical protein